MFTILDIIAYAVLAYAAYLGIVNVTVFAMIYRDEWKKINQK